MIVFNKFQKLLLLIVVLLSTTSTFAERVYDNLIFTKEKCNELLGKDNVEFEKCAVIEFCTSSERRSRQLEKDFSSEEEDDDEYSLEDDDDEMNNNGEGYEDDDEEDEDDEDDDEGIMMDNDIDMSTTMQRTKVATKPDATTVMSTNIMDENFAMEVKESIEETKMEQQQQQQQQQKDIINNKNKDSIITNNWNNKKNIKLVQKAMDNGPDGARYGYRIAGSKKCSFPGPIIRLERGIKHGLFLKGNNDEETNLHFHGLHMSGKYTLAGDDMHRYVKGEDNMLVYNIDLSDVTKQHMGGTHWYHSHMHGHAWNQVQGGAFGMIVVGDEGSDDDIGTTDQHVLEFLTSPENEKVLIVADSDGKVHKQGSANQYTANGLEKETLNFNPHQWYRLRILTVGINSHTSEIHIQFGNNDENEDSTNNDTTPAPNCQVHALAHDGIYRFEVPKAKASNYYMLTTSSRLDVAIRCSANIEITANKQLIADINVDYGRDDNNNNNHATPFEDSGMASWKSKRMDYVKDLRSFTEGDGVLQPTMKLRVDETNINGVSEGSHKPLCNKNTDTDFQYNTVEEWKFSGVNTHPFHLHIHPMQIMTEGCSPNHDVGEFYDSILASESKLSNPCIVRIYLTDYNGPATLHCHLFEHSSHGAITYLNVIDHNTNESSKSSSNKVTTTCLGECMEPTEPPQLCTSRRNLLRKNTKN